MALNYIWISFFVLAFLVCLVRLVFFQDFDVFSEVINTLFSRAELGFELSIGLTGVLALWMGILRIGQDGGAISILTKLVSPFFSKLFPEVPKNHPAIGAMVMNFSANMLGLDNAATPMGLEAMKHLQEVNPEKKSASNAQIMFLVLNTSGLTLIPVSILALRATYGSENPTEVFLPILLATFCSSFFGLIITSIIQKIDLFNKVVLSYLGGAVVFVGLLVWYVISLEKEELEIFSGLLSNIILFSIIFSFIVLGLVKKINVYNSFVEGAKEGFKVAIKIIPYLIAMLCGIGVFTASGAMDFLMEGFESIFVFFGMDAHFVDALPTAFMKPLSGGGARAAMVESWAVFENSEISGALKTGAMDVWNTINFPPVKGPDTFVGRLTSILQGSTETTFYVLAVYFGSVNIKNTRYAVGVGLLADLVGIIAAIVFGYLFFGLN